MSEKYTYTSLSEAKCKVKKTEGEESYSVYSTAYLRAGDIIEECVAMEIDITLEKLFNMGDTGLSGLFIKTIPFATGIDNFTGLSIVGGNYISYRHRSVAYNAVYQYDKRFDIVTIRAIQDIKKGDEIFLPRVDISGRNTKPTEELDADVKPKKEKKGCGCGKKRAPVGPNIKKKEPSSRPPKILRDRNPKEEKQVESTKFKSMETGETLKSIEVDK